MDLSTAYLKGVRQTCRNATVVHDKYHVIANLILAAEKVRRREQKQRPELKDSRWLLRKNPENLSEEQTAELAVLTQSNLASVKAYQMRLAFQDAYRLEHAGAARRRLEAWRRWVRLGPVAACPGSARRLRPSHRLPAGCAVRVSARAPSATAQRAG
jgi:transposase